MIAPGFGTFLGSQWLARAWYRLKARQAARLAATSHMAMIANALLTGSTEAYTLRVDLQREPDSTRVIW